MGGVGWGGMVAADSILAGTTEYANNYEFHVTFTHTKIHVRSRESQFD